MNGPERTTMSNVGSGRKSRQPESRVSFIPKPKSGPRQNTFDRLSEIGMKRPARSSSIDRGRSTLSIAGRKSRDTVMSSNKITKQRSKSQAPPGSEPYMTPLMKVPYPRMTTTPRTPSGDRSGRNWQKSVERALAYVIVKDRRTITNPVWQKAEMVRVQSLLDGRSLDKEPLTLVRPLTIARFVEIVSRLMSVVLHISEKHKINVVNYVTFLPRFTKKLLYPGTVSKSWLKTVNTLHTFPNALALISYLVDIVARFEAPIDDEWLYVSNDEISRLKREYLYKVWYAYQHYDNQAAVDDEYIQNLGQLLGFDEKTVQKLQMEIDEFKEKLSDPVEVASAEDEMRRAERVTTLATALKDAQNEHTQIQTDIDGMEHKISDLKSACELIDTGTHRLKQEVESLKTKLESQTMTVAEREKILDKVDYTNRIIGSKKDLIDKVNKMLETSDLELTRLQKQSLDSCVGYNQRLIHLSRKINTNNLHIEERDLIHPDTCKRVTETVSMLKEHKKELTDELHRAERDCTQQRRRVSEQNSQLSQLNAKRVQLEEVLERERKCFREERETVEALASKLEREARQESERVSEIDAQIHELEEKAKEEDAMWAEQDNMWNNNLSEMSAKVEEYRNYVNKMLDKWKEQRLGVALASFSEMDSQMRRMFDSKNG